MPRKAVFCPACGQRDTDGKVELKDLFSKLWITVFHIDNKLFRTLAHLCVPAKITQEYFKGRMKRYLHPIQFYLLTMVFAVYVMTQNAVQNNKSAEPEEMIFNRGKIAMVEQIKSSIKALPPEMKAKINPNFRKWSLNSYILAQFFSYIEQFLKLPDLRILLSFLQHL